MKYYQPDLTNSAVDLYSFQVYHSHGQCQRDYPNIPIFEYENNDIEEPSFIDDNVKVYASSLLDNFIKVIPYEHFTYWFQGVYEEGEIDIVFLTDSGKIACLDIYGDFHENII